MCKIVQNLFLTMGEKNMRKINMSHDNKDRIICVSGSGKLKFYYQPFGTRERIWFFDTKNFSSSVFAFFCKYGRCLDDIGFSMTIKEIYEISNKRNVKLTRIIERIPIQVEYVLRESNGFIQMPCIDIYKMIDNVITEKCNI